MGHIEESALLLVQSGEEQSETSPLPGLFGNRRLYAAQGAELRAAPSDDAEVLFTFDTYDESCYLLGGVLPNGYIRVRSTLDESREGYILATQLDYANW